MKTRLYLLFVIALLAMPWSALADPLPEVLRMDQARIREHLASVEAYLGSRDTSNLSESQRDARAETINHLHEYWVDGVFPRNTLRSYPTPIFIDPAGRACALGYLMIASGWEDEARLVAERENLAYVNAIRSPEAAAWIEQSGLTPQEAAWIQPEYGPYCWDGCPCDEQPVCAADGLTYLNPCFAEACDGQEVYVAGCCTLDEGARQEVFGAAICRCLSGAVLPEECRDDSYALGADLCGDLVEPPPLPTNSGCAAARGVSASSWAQLHLAGLALLVARRRRRRRRH